MIDFIATNFMGISWIYVEKNAPEGFIWQMQ